MTAAVRPLAELGATELVDAFVENVRACETADHIGRHNRLFAKRARILDALKARTDGTLSALLPLLAHADRLIRYHAIFPCREVDGAAAAATLRELAAGRDKIAREARAALEWQERYGSEPAPAPRRRDESAFWQSRRDMPRGNTVEDWRRRLQDGLPADRAAAILALARTAIVLWPRRVPAEAPAAGSHLGGMPGVPAAWSWPVFFDEPMLFLGQIDCADLAGFAAAAGLPRQGVLTFFGDHDAVTGCTEPVGLGETCYFPRRDALVAAPAPVEDFKILPRCALQFYETVDLPDPRSDTIERLQLSGDEADRYWQIWLALSGHGGEKTGRHGSRVSKLFGWPHLIQHDLDAIGDLEGGNGDWRLLMQLGDYENGADIHSWGPGGLVYFVIREADLAARRFGRALLDMQCA